MRYGVGVLTNLYDRNFVLNVSMVCVGYFFPIEGELCILLSCNAYGKFQSDRILIIMLMLMDFFFSDFIF